MAEDIIITLKRSNDLLMTFGNDYSDVFLPAIDEIERLRTVAVKRGLWKEAPCCVCGYNGPNYFQPSVHKCAAIEEKE